MRKGLVLVLLSILAFTAFGQITIEKEVDEMTDEVNYVASERFYVANEAKTLGFAIDVMLGVKDGIMYSKGWIVTTADLGGCNEDNEMIILFEDGSKITLESFNKFNCDEVAFFILSLEQEVFIANKRIKKIRFKNGFSYETYTNEVDYPNYFIELYNAIEVQNK